VKWVSFRITSTPRSLARAAEVVKTRSRANIHVEVCSKCHPFFTGKQKIMDTAGRVERFQRKYKRQPAAAQ